MPLRLLRDRGRRAQCLVGCLRAGETGQAVSKANQGGTVSVETVEAKPGTRIPRGLLLVAGLIAVLVAAGAWFLSTTVLTEGTFQGFPGSEVSSGDVPNPVAYDQSQGGDVTYTLTAMNESSTSVTLLSATVEPGPFSTSSVDLPTTVELAPGAEARLLVHGTFASCTPGQSPFTAPVPGASSTFRQLGIQRTQPVTG